MEAAKAFQLDWEEFRDRHDSRFPPSMPADYPDQYLDRTLFLQASYFPRENLRPSCLPSRRSIRRHANCFGSRRIKKYFVASINNSHANEQLSD